ncbi:MAG TPA: zinc-binding dehydrogenase [Amycolatopsis sp.]|nr:zinc-binding dehydrogenase [Amycolatopsis sp.]
MRAVQVREFGGPEVLVEAVLPEPVAGPGEVVVGVAYAAIDFVQTQLRRGYSPGPPLPGPPYVPGATVSGEVIGVGEGVDSGWVGRRVVTRTANAQGGYAERALAPADALVAVPGATSLADAAALHDDGATALGLMENAQVRPGEWVLVEAAGGGVGSLLVRLALAAGAQVVGAAASGAKRDLVRRLGAKAVDYTEPDWTDQVVALTGRGPDVVFDGVGGELGRAALAVVAPGGRFSIHGASSGSPTVAESGTDITVIPISQLFTFGEHTTRRVGQVLTGGLTPTIGQTLPLARAAAAHAAMEARTVTGKTLLVVS